LARTKFKNKIITTEKIKELGKSYNFCPYYYPLYVKPICNLFFMPYNYLLDDSLSDRYKEIIEKSILIFDEAHNVPDSACDGKSFSVGKRTF
jgi:Rad3-related DNA helicase